MQTIHITKFTVDEYTQCKPCTSQSLQWRNKRSANIQRHKVGSGGNVISQSLHSASHTRHKGQRSKPYTSQRSKPYTSRRTKVQTIHVTKDKGPNHTRHKGQRPTRPRSPHAQTSLVLPDVFSLCVPDNYFLALI